MGILQLILQLLIENYYLPLILPFLLLDAFMDNMSELFTGITLENH